MSLDTFKKQLAKLLGNWDQTIKVDAINEYSGGSGVTIDGVQIIDSGVGSAYNFGSSEMATGDVGVTWTLHTLYYSRFWPFGKRIDWTVGVRGTLSAGLTNQWLTIDASSQWTVTEISSGAAAYLASCDIYNGTTASWETGRIFFNESTNLWQIERQNNASLGTGRVDIYFQVKFEKSS